MMANVAKQESKSTLFSFVANNLTPPLLTERSATPSSFLPLLGESAVLGKEEGAPQDCGVGGCLKKEKIKFIEYNRGYVEYAQKNRKHPTRVESVFWGIVRNKKLLGYKFRRQKNIGSFILDFYCSKLLLGIELDGGYHNDRADYDIYRDSEIYKKGILVIRFRNEDIEKNILGVIRELKKTIKERQEMLILNS